jgi:putative membrane protein insertion efficiency factor
MAEYIKVFILVGILGIFTSMSHAEQWDFGKSVRASAQISSIDLEADESAFTRIIRRIQRSISAVDGDRCPLYPTCSAYSLEAFKKHGFLIGFMMTAGRLIQESDESETAPRIAVGNRIMPYDPVSRNDFWWFKGSVLTENNP